MGRMGGVLHDTFGFAGASCKENIQDEGERGTDDFCSCVHCPLESLAALQFPYQKVMQLVSMLSMVPL